MSDPAAFVRAALSGVSAPVPLTDAVLREFQRTPELARQFARVAEAHALLNEVEDYRERVRTILRREVATFNQMNLAEITRATGVNFDA